VNSCKDNSPSTSPQSSPSYAFFFAVTHFFVFARLTLVLKDTGCPAEKGDVVRSLQIVSIHAVSMRCEARTVVTWPTRPESDMGQTWCWQCRCLAGRLKPLFESGVQGWTPTAAVSCSACDLFSPNIWPSRAYAGARMLREVGVKWSMAVCKELGRVSKRGRVGALQLRQQRTTARSCNDLCASLVKALVLQSLVAESCIASDTIVGS
jgi:hypothetical protein